MDSECHSILFRWFALLVDKLARVPPHPRDTSLRIGKGARLKILRSWILELRTSCTPLPSDTISIFFRLLFPEEDSRRRYNMQETTLANKISQVFGLNKQLSERAHSLRDWNKTENMNEKTGCLGDTVMSVMEDLCAVSNDADRRGLTFQQVDCLLDELAGTSAWSTLHGPKVMGTKRSRVVILRDLFGNASPREGQILTQIILQDLRPVLYPLSSLHTTTALLQYNTSSVEPLSKYDVMKEWNSSMSSIYASIASLDEASRIVSSMERTSLPVSAKGSKIMPQIGVPVEIPKCSKAQSCVHALNILRQSRKIWVETKYDGERMQIHVDLRKPANQITIFSKSKRNSTLDRIATHSTILEALGLPSRDGRLVKSTVILEAEMVAFSEKNDSIDEFWRIRDIIAKTAVGVRRQPSRYNRDIHCEGELSDDSEECPESRHLMLVFFDILYHDGTSLLDASYEQRRALLEKVIFGRNGFACVAERQCLDSANNPLACASLREIFASHIAGYQEGLVLKAVEASYCDWRMPWVKLKRDYIPGYGDTADLVAFGASWDKDRARELRVPPNTFTTFYVGLLDNEPSIQSKKPPHLVCLFTVAYGLNREQLEELNFLVKSAEQPSGLKSETQSFPYTFSLNPNILPPSLLFSQPFVMELFGAGFTKTGSKFYELRFPRVAKYFRRSERDWNEALTLQAFQEIARRAVGQERPYKDIDDAINSDWLKPCSPRANSWPLVAFRKQEWADVLSYADEGHPPPKERLRILSTHHIDAYSTSQGKDVRTSPLLPLHPKHKKSDGRSSKRTSSKRTSQLLLLEAPFAKRQRLRDSALITSSPGILLPTTVMREISVNQNGGDICPPIVSRHRNKGSLQVTAVRTDLKENSPDMQRYSPTPSHNSEAAKSPQSALMRYLYDAQVWVDPTSLSSATASLLYQIVPSGHLSTWIGAFFITLGWSTGLPQPYSRSIRKGVLFVKPDELSSLVNIITAKRLEVGIDNPLKEIVIFPADMLSLPSPTHDPEQSILWRSEAGLGISFKESTSTLLK